MSDTWTCDKCGTVHAMPTKWGESVRCCGEMLMCTDVATITPEQREQDIIQDPTERHLQMVRKRGEELAEKQNAAMLAHIAGEN